MRYYSNQAVSTTLLASITNTSTSITVDDVTGFPGSFPYTLILDEGTATEEVVEVNGASGATLQVLRGVDGSTAVNHASNATVVHGVSARDYREPQQHIAATAGVHGLALSSSLVGTTDTQVLTNKTLSGGIVDGATITNSTIAGTQVTGTVPNATHAVNADTVPGTGVTGTVASATASTKLNGLKMAAGYNVINVAGDTGHGDLMSIPFGITFTGTPHVVVSPHAGGAQSYMGVDGVTTTTFNAHVLWDTVAGLRGFDWIAVGPA